MEHLPKDRIDELPKKPEHLRSKQLDLPFPKHEPEIITASIHVNLPKPVIENG
jgi:hypothetical protein